MLQFLSSVWWCKSGIMAEDLKCSIAGTACVPCAVPLPCAPGDLELPLSASLLFGIFWKAILLMCKAEWMCQGIKPHRSNPHSVSNGNGCMYNPDPQYWDTCLHLSPKFSCGTKLQSPAVETGSLMDLLLAAFPSNGPWTFRETTCTQIIVSGVCFWGHPNKDMLQFCPDSLFLPRIPE